MSKTYHVVKQGDGWTVKAESARRASSRHRTLAEATAAGRDLAAKNDAQLVVHAADGTLRERNTYGRASAPRAPRNDGSRTTLRVPADLLTTADHLADELGISRNDALLRLTTRGAQLYEMERDVAVRRAQRWSAVVPGDVAAPTTDFPSPDEVDAILLSLDDDPAAAGDR